MSLNLNTFTLAQSGTGAVRPMSSLPGIVDCPGCGGDLTSVATRTDWQNCPYCDKRLQIRVWTAARQNANAASAMPEQATCFFHPEKAFQACCQWCGRFMCALCDLQLGAEHVCPVCFERGRADMQLNGDKTEWRHRDVLYDSIAIAVGWGWIVVWPVFVVALPATVVLHVKYRKAPRSYLIPRSGWRFWMAYVGLVWVWLLAAGLILIPRLMVRH